LEDHPLERRVEFLDKTVFSKRFHWDISSNPLSRLLEEKKGNGETIIDLTVSNPTRVGLHYQSDEILSAIAAPDSMLYQPEAQGLPVARRAIANYYSLHGMQVDPAQILLTSGTSEAYAFLFKLLTDPGDEAMVPQPSYPLFDLIAGLEHVTLQPYTLRYHEGRWMLDMLSVEAAVSSRTRALIIVQPNNPTGSYFRDPDLSSLFRFCAERRIALIADEVFFDFTLESGIQPTSTLSRSPNTLLFTLNGLSKMIGLPQSNLSWIVVRGPEALCNDAMQKLDLISDTFLSVGTPVQHAAPMLLDTAPHIQQQIRERCRRNFVVLNAAASRFPVWEVLNVEGGWSASLYSTQLDDEDSFVRGLLQTRNVYVYPGYFFDFPKRGYIVVSLLTNEAEFRQGIDALFA